MDKQYYVSRRWAIASDGVQWILQRKEGKGWRNTIFVRTDRDILERCMREDSVPLEDRLKLVYGLPQTFSEWWGTQSPLDNNNRCEGCLNAV